jgi:hypothetical protein
MSQALTAAVIGPGQQSGIDIAHEVLEGCLQGVGKPALDHRTDQIAEQIVVQVLQPLRRRVGVAVIGSELGDDIGERLAASLQILGIGDAQPHEGLVDVGLVRAGADIGVIQIVPHDRNRLRDIHAEFGLDRVEHVVDVIRRRLQPVQRRVHRRVQRDSGFQVAGNVRALDSERIPALDHRARNLARNHRRVVGAGDVDGDIDRIRGAVFVLDRYGEDVRYRLTRRQRLRRRQAVIELVGPLAGIGIDREAAIGAGGIA